jgi:hypothetical protein
VQSKRRRLSLLHHRLHERRRVQAELADQAEMLGLLDGHGIEPVFGQAEQAGAGIGHQDRGERRHDHLAEAEPDHAAQQLEELDLAGWRQRRFWRRGSGMGPGSPRGRPG